MLSLFLTAAALSASPSNVATVIAGAKPGDVITLGSGNYPVITVRGKSWSPPITLKASSATLSRIVIDGSSGVTLTGGTILGSGEAFQNTATAGYGINVSKSSVVKIEGVTIRNFARGIVIGRSSAVQVRNNKLLQLRTDGIDLGDTSGAIVSGNACSEFYPIAGDHPDCIQVWGSAGQPAPADMIITGNTARGNMQGIGLFNTQPGYDRITITSNVVRVTAPQGIALYGGRDSIISNNDVANIGTLKTSINLVSTARTVACGNLVPNASWVPAAQPCKTGQ